MIIAPRVCSAFAATALLASTLPSFGIEAVLTDDATIAVSATTLSKKFGTAATLALSPTQRALLRFDLTTTLPSEVTDEMIQHATLKLWISGVRAAGSIGVKPITAAWDERTVAGGSAPTTGAGTDNVATVDATSVRQYLIIDVTEYVKIWRANGNANFGVQLASAQASVTFDSKENGLTGRAPVLEIAYAGSGPQGSPGTPGAAATVTVGAVTTGAPGSSAAVTNSGNANAAILNFSIPKGEAGAAGQQGTAATIAVGTVTTGNAGTPAAVTNAGTSNAALLNFTIPKGEKGDPGEQGPAGPVNQVAVRATNNSNAQITSTTAPVTLWTEVNDTHSAFDPTNGVFTAPVAGTYVVAARFGLDPAAATAWATGESAIAVLQKGTGTPVSYNGYSYLASLRADTGHSSPLSMLGTDTIKLGQGETVRVTLAMEAGNGAKRLIPGLSGTLSNYINIYRVAD